MSIKNDPPVWSDYRATIKINDKLSNTEISKFNKELSKIIKMTTEYTGKKLNMNDKIIIDGGTEPEIDYTFLGGDVLYNYERGYAELNDWDMEHTANRIRRYYADTAWA